MPHQTIAVPAQGKAGKRSLIKAIIDELVYLYSIFAGSTSTAPAPNGSFEIDTDANGVPDEWTYTAGAGAGTGVKDATDSSHGGSSFKFTRNLGAGNSGGTLETSDYFECTPSRRYVAAFWLKCSAAGMRVKVEFRFFDKAKVFISSVTPYTSITNPTVWTPLTAEADSPSTAYYCKLKITGGDTAPDVAGTIRFDDLSVTPAGHQNSNCIVFTANGTFTPVVPRVRIRAWGGGAGGGGGNINTGPFGGGGGGGGAYAEAWFDVVPGVGLSVTIGTSGNAGTTGNDGTNGGNTSVGSIITANGGTKGTGASTVANGTGGAGGTTGSATITFPGGNGGDGCGTNSASNVGHGGDGGAGSCGGPGGPASGNSSAGVAGRNPGGGGSGGHGSNAGGAGGAGRVIVDW